MKCPACLNVLTPQPVAGITVDICEGGCGGVWLDAFELQRLGKYQGPETDFLLQIGREPAVVPDPIRKRQCPRCSEVKLKRRFFSAKRKIEIDECPGCGGLWLDGGELEAVRRELDDNQKAPAVDDRQPRLTMTVIRQIYRFHLAERGEGSTGAVRRD